MLANVTRRFSLKTVLLTAAILGGLTTAAFAGLATSVGCEALITYNGSPSDLVVSMQLTESATGRVLWQATGTDITVTDLGSTISYEVEHEPDDWNYDSTTRWNLVVDATGAGSSTVVSSWTQTVVRTGGTSVYSANVSGNNIQGNVSTVRFVGETARYLTD
jgi:hypothetical protein